MEDNLPKHLKQTEMFAKGGEYDAACRYSTEPGDPGLDVSVPLHFMSTLDKTNPIFGPTLTRCRTAYPNPAALPLSSLV